MDGMSEDTPDTPEELRARDKLTRTLLGLMFDRATTFAVGRVPDGWPESLIPPPPAVVVGGMKAGQMITVVFGYPPETGPPVTEYRAFLERDGWTLLDDLMKGGFHARSHVTLHRGSSMLDVRSATSESADNGSIIVSLKPYEERPILKEMQRFRLDTISVPRLEAPDGVRFSSGGGGGGGGGGDDHIYRHARITTNLTPAELLPLYLVQLTDAGWTAGELSVNASAATQWVEAPDAKGRTWRGLLAVYVNGPGREVFIYMARTAE
jgi:hypothetical protein